MSKSKVIKQLPMKFTLSKKERQQNKEKNIISSLEDKYFCHYNNSLYMGGMKAYKKHGIGLILYDDEVTAILSHSNDVPTGHNIIFRNGLLISKVYNIDKSIDVMFRMKRYLLQINYKNKYGTDGKGILIDYHLRKVHTISFIKAQLKQKLIVRNQEVLRQVFSKNNLKKYIGDNHYQAITFNFNKPKDFKIFKDGNIIKMGFQQDGKFKGLGIKLNYIIQYQSPQFQLQIIQRGQYESSVLNGFGQKRFENKNLYYGQFKYNLFHGKGILCHPNDNKWVLGYFQAGNMKQMIKVNNQRNGKWYNSVLKQFHTLNDKWIDYSVQIPQQTQEKQLFDIVIDANDNSQELNQSIKQKQKSQLIMKAITQRFVGRFNSQINILLNNAKNSIQKLEERQQSISKLNSKSKSRQKSKQRQYSQSKSLSQSKSRQNIVSSRLQNNFIIQSPKDSKIDRLNSTKYSTSKKKVIFQSEMKQYPIRIDLLPVLYKYQDPEITFRKDKQQDQTGYDKLKASMQSIQKNNYSPINKHILIKSPPSKLSGRSKSNNSPKRDNFFSSTTAKKPSNEGTIYSNIKKQRSKTPKKQYKDIRYQNYKKQFQPEIKQYRPRKYYKYLDEKDQQKLYDKPIRNGSILKRR